MSASVVGAIGEAGSTATLITAVYGQTPTANNLLLALVAAGSQTLETPNINTSATGWSRLISATIADTTSGTGYVFVDAWVKEAVGGDSAPSFAQTLGSTGREMTCHVLEINDANFSDLLDVQGVFQYSVAGTCVFSLSTSGNVSNSGSIAVDLMAQFRATATTSTWTETGTGWTSAGLLPSGSSALSVQCNYKLNPATGSSVSDGGHFSTDSTAYGAGIILVINGTTTPVPVDITGVAAAITLAGGVGTVTADVSALVSGVAAEIVLAGGVGSVTDNSSITHVGDASTGWVTGSSATIEISGVAGNVLTLSAEIYHNDHTSPITVTSVSDSAGNTWRYSTTDNNQNLPAAGVDQTDYYGLAFIACCLNIDQESGQVQAVTSVTIEFSSAADGGAYPVVSQWSNIPEGLTVDAAASSLTTGSGTTQVTPSITTTGSSDIVIAQTTEDNQWTSVNSPFTLVDGSDSAWAIVTPGSHACTFNYGSSNSTGTSAILALGVPSGEVDISGVAAEIALAGGIGFVSVSASVDISGVAAEVVIAGGIGSSGSVAPLNKTPALYVLAGSGDVAMTNLAAAEAATGVTFNILEVFNTNCATWDDWTDPWFCSDSSQGYISWVAADTANRRLIVSMNLISEAGGSMSDPLTWETSGAAGGFNSYATTLAENLVAAGFGNSIIRLGLECNGNWNIDSIYGTTTPYGGTTEMQSLWAQTFQQEVTAMRAVTGANFLFCWCPNAVVASIPFANYYPGNDYVDIIGIDQYDAFANGSQPTASPTATADLFAQNCGINDITTFAVAQGKPLALGEYGIQTIDNGGLGDDPYYIEGLATWIADNNFAFHSYFDSNNDGIAPLTSSYPLTLAAYKAAFGTAVSVSISGVSAEIIVAGGIGIVTLSPSVDISGVAAKITIAGGIGAIAPPVHGVAAEIVLTGGSGFVTATSHNRVTWDDAERYFSQGISNGVLYPKNSPGVAWNGLISVTEKGDAESSPFYIDGQLYLNRLVPDAFEGTISAFMYPDEFEPYSGNVRVATGQTRPTFGLSYRSNSEIHIVYNVLAEPSANQFSSLGEDVSPVAFSWDFTTLPISIPGARPSAHLVINTNYAVPEAISALEDILYGDEANLPSLPTPSTVFSMFDSYAILNITDNGDGTWTAETDQDGIIEMLGTEIFQINWSSAVVLSSTTYKIGSL